MGDPIGLVLHVFMGLGLAACTGLRAFMPLFVVGVMARAGQLPLGPDFQFLTTDPALVAFGAATLVEVIGDKLPAVDHALDAAGLFVKPIAATALFASVMVDMPPLHATVLGMMAAGSTATVMHVKKATVRLLSSVSTLGLANPILSTAEDAVCGVGVVLSVVVPVIAVILAGLLVAAGYWRLKATASRRAALGMGGRAPTAGVSPASMDAPPDSDRKTALRA